MFIYLYLLEKEKDMYKSSMKYLHRYYIKICI